MTLLKNVSVKIPLNGRLRCLCTKQAEEKAIRKYVYISQSNDIFTNLALEDWIYSKSNFTDMEILMLWWNRPCVVIGRHQNPWLEANVEKLANITADGVKLARRNSGGGTVYHDEGNLNMTFFTTKDKYNRKHNLEIIKRALFKEYNLKVDISEREDLVLRDYKVSGTASKLARLNSYHHCTLLINSNKDHMHQALHRSSENLKTRATKSIRSPIMNLKEENPKVKNDNTLRAIGIEFLQSRPSPNPREKNLKMKTVDSGFHLVNPTEPWFPGISSIKENLESWDWIYGMCPDFSVSRNIDISHDQESKTVTMKVQVEKGRISDVVIDYPDNLEKAVCFGTQIFSDFKSREYSSEIVNKIHSIATNMLNEIVERKRNQAS